MRIPKHLRYFFEIFGDLTNHQIPLSEELPRPWNIQEKPYREDGVWVWTHVHILRFGKGVFRGSDIDVDTHQVLFGEFWMSGCEMMVFLVGQFLWGSPPLKPLSIPNVGPNKKKKILSNHYMLHMRYTYIQVLNIHSYQTRVIRPSLSCVLACNYSSPKALVRPRFRRPRWKLASTVIGSNGLFHVTLPETNISLKSDGF